MQVWFDGVMWVARRAGFPGRVFGKTEAEVVARVNERMWKHLTPRELNRKRSQP